MDLYFFISSLISIAAISIFKSAKYKDEIIRNLNELENIESHSNNIFIKYLEKIRYETKLNGVTFIYTDDPVNFLIPKALETYRNSLWILIGYSITGLSLILTFITIGLKVSDIGTGLSNLISSSSGQESITGLGIAIKDIAFKFYISVAGLGSSLIFNLFSKSFEKQITSTAFEKCRILRKTGKLKEVLDIELQHETNNSINNLSQRLNSEINEFKNLSQLQHQETIETLRSIPQIEVCIQSLSAQLNQDLANMLDKQVGEKITELLDEQRSSSKVMAEKISQALSDSLGPELKKIFEQLGEKLPDLVSNGATTSTQEVGKILSKVGQELPSLITSIETITRNLQGEIKNTQNINQQTLDHLIINMNDLISHFSNISRTASEDTERSVRAVSTVTEEATHRVLESINATNDFVSNIKNVMNDFTHFNQNLSNQNTTQIQELRNMIQTFNTAFINVRSESEQLTNLVTQLNDIMRNISHLPSQTTDAVQLMNQKIEDIKTNTIELEKTYQSGVEQMFRLYSDNIEMVQKQADKLSTIYSRTWDDLSDNLAPLEEIKQPITELKDAILKLNLNTNR